MIKNFNFFKESIKNYKTTGTITPSSKHLASRMLKKINFKTADVIVELGPGNGAITKHILKKIHPKATLICFEINDAFYNELLKINHPQLVVLKASAENILEELEKLNLTKACHVVSSLPLTIIPPQISNRILKNAFKSLSHQGTYIQYQYNLSYFRKLKLVFGKKIALDFEPLNLPPAFVYRCVK